MILHVQNHRPVGRQLQQTEETDGVVHDHENGWLVRWAWMGLYNTWILYPCSWTQFFRCWGVVAYPSNLINKRNKRIWYNCSRNISFSFSAMVSNFVIWAKKGSIKGKKNEHWPAPGHRVFSRPGDWLTTKIKNWCPEWGVEVKEAWHTKVNSSSSSRKVDHIGSSLNLSKWTIPKKLCYTNWNEKWVVCKHGGRAGTFGICVCF